MTRAEGKGGEREETGLRGASSRGVGGARGCLLL
jgi:hypothetical protein